MGVTGTAPKNDDSPNKNDGSFDSNVINEMETKLNDSLVNADEEPDRADGAVEQSGGSDGGSRKSRKNQNLTKRRNLRVSRVSRRKCNTGKKILRRRQKTRKKISILFIFYF